MSTQLFEAAFFRRLSERGGPLHLLAFVTPHLELFVANEPNEQLAAEELTADGGARRADQYLERVRKRAARHARVAARRAARDAPQT